MCVVLTNGFDYSTEWYFDDVLGQYHDIEHEARHFLTQKKSIGRLQWIDSCEQQNKYTYETSFFEEILE